MATALGIAPVTGSGGALTGCTPDAHRRAIGARYDAPGKVWGFAVSRTGSLSLGIGEGVAVAAYGAADLTDGAVEAYWPGGSVTLAAGDPSNPRIDAVVLVAHDVAAGDGDNQVALEVVRGTPAATPAAPALERSNRRVTVARVRVPAAATATSAMGDYGADLTCDPRFTARGLVASATNPYAGHPDMSDGGRDYYEQTCSFHVETDRTMEFVMFGTIAASNAQGTDVASDDAALGAYFQCVQLDGRDLDGGGVQVPLQRPWTNFRHSVVARVSAGSHTARVRQHRLTWGRAPWFVSGTYTTANPSGATETYPPRTLQVWDRGKA